MPMCVSIFVKKLKKKSQKPTQSKKKKYIFRPDKLQEMRSMAVITIETFVVHSKRNACDVQLMVLFTEKPKMH